MFDGAENGGPDERSGRVEVRFSRPPKSADDVIREIVEARVGGDEQVTVVTADLEVARHARAMGAEISISDLFMASALGPGAGSDTTGGEVEKPTTLTKKELEEWAEVFRRRQGREEPEQ